MVLNPNKTKALVVTRSRSVSHPHRDLVLSVVSIRGNSNIDILAVKFNSKLTFEDHVCGIISRFSQRFFFEVGETYIGRQLCVTSLLFRIYFTIP